MEQSVKWYVKTVQNMHIVHVTATWECFHGIKSLKVCDVSKYASKRVR